MDCSWEGVVAVLRKTGSKTSWGSELPGRTVSGARFLEEADCMHG
jgi:hypothetical protein